MHVAAFPRVCNLHIFIRTTSLPLTFAVLVQGFSNAFSSLEVRFSECQYFMNTCRIFCGLAPPESNQICCSPHAVTLSTDKFKGGCLERIEKKAALVGSYKSSEGMWSGKGVLYRLLKVCCLLIPPRIACVWWQSGVWMESQQLWGLAGQEDLQSIQTFQARIPQVKHK